MGECLFCGILEGRIGSAHVLTTVGAVVIRDIAPQAPGHFLVLSRQHVALLHEASPEVVAGLFEAAGILARQEGFDRQGYRAVINVGEQGGQTVPHLHLHLLAGRPMNWPPG